MKREEREGAASAGPYGPGVARMAAGGAPAASDAAAAPPARPAATVVLLRDGPSGLLEVYLVRRAGRLAFMGGVHVFPGGRVDAKDPNPEAAAVRETEEEVSVRLDVRALRPWSRWVTPEIEPKRFDALFYLAPLPRGQEARAVPGEVTDGLWLAPREAAARMERGVVMLAQPTLWTLLELAPFATAGEALAAAERRPPSAPCMPRALDRSGAMVLLMPGDPCYDDPGADPPLERQRRFLLREGRWEVRGAPG